MDACILWGTFLILLPLTLNKDVSKQIKMARLPDVGKKMFCMPPHPPNKKTGIVECWSMLQILLEFLTEWNIQPKKITQICIHANLILMPFYERYDKMWSNYIDKIYCEYFPDDNFHS